VATLKTEGDFATQAGHWYELDGTPRYTIIGANGKERPTTLRDAKSLNLVPSVTMILRKAAAPALVRWQIEQAVNAAIDYPPKEGEDRLQAIARIIRTSQESSAQARNIGTLIHGAIERLDSTGPYADHVAAAMAAVATWSGLQDWDAERSFACELGYGGKIDLSRDRFLIDFKTSEKPIDTLKTWPDHRRQLAAYRLGLNRRNARCAIVYVQVQEPKARVIELGQDELEKGEREFLALLDLWKAEHL
jgi:hypothetical protein